MKISYLWLKELTGIDWPPEEVAERLTLSGTACEDIESTAKHFDKVVVGKIVDLLAIEGADKIKKAVVDTGKEKLDIICGAPNATVGQKVPVALVGASLAGDLEIRKVKIRGVESSGMICSEAELGISDDHSGILVLDPDAPLGVPLVQHLDYDDYILDFELTPNRGDSMSAIGIARDLAVLASTNIKYPSFELKSSGEKAENRIKVGIDDSHACPRFTARIIRNVKIGPSPWWVKKKLLTAGMRPISNVVDISNLVMLETGNPIHSFDLDRFGSNEVLVRRATDGEKLVTLDGNEHTLTPEVLMITNGRIPVAAAGIMGGLDTEVTDRTTNILLEVAYFQPSVIRAGRKQLGFVSEASNRFEKGVDPNNVPNASARAAYLFQELCDGEVLEGYVDCYPEEISPVTLSFRPDRCNAVLGTDYNAERMAEIFRGLEFTVKNGHPMQVTVPTVRPDITGEIDLVEEVARIQGYDSIPDALRNVGPLYSPDRVDDLFEEELRRILTASGFDEMVSHGLSHSRHAHILDPGRLCLRIVNPVSEDLDIMRNSLVLTALPVVAHNLAHRNMDFRLFEIGKAYSPPDSSDNWREEDRLLLLGTGNSPVGWREKPRPIDFYDLVGALDNLRTHFGWPKITFEEINVGFLDRQVSYELKAGDQVVGMIGKIAREVGLKFDLKQDVVLAELSISDLIAVSRELGEFIPLPVFPAASRDLAVVVDAETRVGDVLETVTETAGPLAETVDIFDLYTGKQTGTGKKSVGVTICYRSSERSLASEEVDNIQRNVIDMLKRNFNAEIREG